jgi:hypothetical protein
MNRLDLIIENIEYAKLVTEQAHKDELLDEALAAARSLRELKPVAWWNPRYETDFAIALKEYQGWNVPLYALEDTK